MCSPKIAKRLRQPEDLSGETLLHDATWRGDWARWLEHADVSGCDGLRGPVFSLYSLALEEAKHGAGVLIGTAPLVEDALRSGALVQPFKLKLRDEPPLAAATRDAGNEGIEARIVRWLQRRR